MSDKKVILTGMQPTGKLHLGNLLGAVNNWHRMLNNYDCLFFLADQHAITVPHIPADLRENTLDCVAQYIACDLDPERCKIFVQSQVIGHLELMWILSCLTPIGQLERMTQFKDKSKKLEESVYSGLLFYPVLMAADILLYNANLVPIGTDQKQHLELTRDIAQRFNGTFSETFALPEPYIGQVGARVMSLQNPTAKMSKSDKNQSGVVYITDTDDAIWKKINGAVTDSGSRIEFDEKAKPGISNLLNIFAAIADMSIEAAVEQFSSLGGYAAFKRAVADVTIAKISPIRKKYGEVIQSKDYLLSILNSGREDAQRRANKMIAKVYRKVGFATGNNWGT
ncbi:MAG: tryptophan--tRNA ligase [Puniceicoccales bacterium]|jgi:tryptophanyl-tRNA synthetase|nr:tryptophan--tRNA ligase [Puniceicoccales bacterium]